MLCASRFSRDALVATVNYCLGTCSSKSGGNPGIYELLKTNPDYLPTKYYQVLHSLKTQEPQALPPATSWLAG